MWIMALFKMCPILYFSPDSGSLFIMTEFPEKDSIKLQSLCFIYRKYQLCPKSLFQLVFLMCGPDQYYLSCACYLYFVDHLLFFYSVNENPWFSIELPFLQGIGEFYDISNRSKVQIEVEHLRNLNRTLIKLFLHFFPPKTAGINNLFQVSCKKDTAA
ncbi:hypothetical protein ES703_95970 [subsurface metagenome]